MHFNTIRLQDCRAALSPLALFLALGSFAPATAATIGFDTVRDYGGTGTGPAAVVENGFLISGNPESLGEPGTVHLDDAGTGYSSYVSISNGGIFDVLSVDLLAMGQAFYIENSDTGALIPSTYDNVLFEGFLNGELISSQRYSTGRVFQAEFVDLAGLMTGIDLFRISAVAPADALIQSGLGVCLDAPCGHFSVDTVTVIPAAVPLSGSAAFAATGIGALALTGLRRGRAGKRNEDSNGHEG